MQPLSNRLLKNYILGKCSLRELEELHQWVNESEENAQWLFRLSDAYHTRKMSCKVDDVRMLKAEVALLKRISEEVKTKKQQRRKYFIRYAAACVLLLVIAGIGLWTWKSNVPMVEVITHAGERRYVMLPDSSEVWLNGNSTLRYPEFFAQHKLRKIELEGEAYFDVKKDVQRPFTVYNDALTVCVLGTSFNFSSYLAEEQAEVTLLEGCVEVVGNQGEGMITINPNQRVVLDKLTHRMLVSEVYAPLAIAWHNDRIPFKQMRIEDIMKVLETHYEVDIEMGKKLYNNDTYTGEIYCSHTIDSVLKDLSYTIPFRYTRRGKKVVLW